MQSLFGRKFGIVRADRVGRDRKSQQRRLQPSVDGLERRDLMAVLGGSVSLIGTLAVVTPAPTGSNTAIVSNQQVSGTAMVDVNLNGVDHYFTPAQVSVVEFVGQNTSSDETFQNNTGLVSIAFGGSGNNHFVGGSTLDVFYGGSGSNTFDAGTGYTSMQGGTGTNVFNESLTGSGIIMIQGGTNTINGHNGNYLVF